MKKILLSLLVTMLFGPAFSQKYFEGTVEYDISYEPINPGITEDALVQVFGKSLKFYHKDGSYMREYIDGQGKSLRKYIYLAANNRVHVVEMSDPDTIAYFNANEKLFKDYQLRKGPTDTVLGYSCPSWSVSYRYYEKMFQDTLNTRLEYFFCHELPVNPDYYKNYYIWYDIVKKEKSVALKFSEEIDGYFKITYTAKKINHITLSEKVFELDKNAVLMHRDMNE